MSPLTATAESSTSDESHINDLLSGGLAPETTDPGPEDTSVAVAEPEVEEEGGATQDDGDAEGLNEGDEDSLDEGSEGLAEETGEEDLDVTNLETDFAESAYQRAAAHWEKRGVTLDPQDPGQRALLKELMERGQKIAELNAKTLEPPAADTAAPAVTQAEKTPQEMFQASLEGARNYSKERYSPEAAKALMVPVAKAIANFFWGKEGAAKFNFDERGGDDLREFTEALDTAMTMKVVDAMPSILAGIPGQVSKAFPMFEKVISMAERESVVEELVGAKDAKGAVAYPGMDKLIEKGTIKRLMNGPDLKDAVFHKDPYKNTVAKAKAAYMMARGENPNPTVLAKAVRTGREQAAARSQRVAAGKLPPGSSKRGFANTSKTSLKDEILGGNKGGFHALLNEGQ